MYKYVAIVLNTVHQNDVAATKTTAHDTSRTHVLLHCMK